MMRHWILLLGMLLLSGCVSTAGSLPDIVHIQGLKIENQTMMWVSAAQLKVLNTGGFVSCGNIAPGSMCSTGFPETQYNGSPVEITWSQGGRIHSTGEFEIIIPDSLDIDKPAMVQVVITGPNSAGAGLIQ